ncbi:MAG: hypothetical protein ABI863_15145 [Ginsengibacter sp.]
MNLINIPQQILLAVKTNEPLDLFVKMLENISEEKIRNNLSSDNLKKAFWINIYDAFTQVFLLKDQRKYQ